MENTIDLQSFIRQHEEDRATCRKLMNDIQQQVNPQTIQKNVLSFWKQQLQPHIHEEESRLFPFLIKRQFNQEYMTVLKREHETICLLAERLPLHEAGDYLYKVFVKLATQHGSFESDVIYHKIQETLSAAAQSTVPVVSQRIRA